MVALRLIEKSRLDNPAVDSVQPCWAMADAAQWIEDGLAEGRIRIDAFD